MTHSEHLFDALMFPLEIAGFSEKRRGLVPQSRGSVLEVGAGTGSNLRYYNPDLVDRLVVTDLEPGELLRRRLSRTTHHWPERVEIELLHADLMELPFPDASFDTVVVTLVLCSVPDQRRAVSELKRVLTTGGKLLFLEHIRPGDGGFARVVDHVNPAWYACNGECMINRRTIDVLSSEGFHVSAEYSGGGLVACGEATP